MKKIILSGFLLLSTIFGTLASTQKVEAASGDQIVSIAKQYIGAPYKYGGTTPSGFDCSGYTQYVFNQAGVSIPRTAASQAGIGTSVSKSSLQPGDLVFFNTGGSGISHVGIYIGSNQFISSENTYGVKIRALSDSYWGPKYVTARRVVQGSTLSASVSYKAHIQNIGWQNTVSNGAVAGTTGQSLRMEAIQITVGSPDFSGGVSYQAHVQNIGWQSSVSNGQTAGTTGQALQMEAIKINLSGDIANHYDIYYRAHVENIGWQGWVKNGAVAGTTGQGLRMEAIQIELVPKGQPGP